MQKIEGEPGQFTATVKKIPGYVDEKICNDCGDCYSVCPVEVKDRFNRDLGTRKAIAKYSPQAVPNIAGILKLGHAPCKVSCPANINVQGYIQLIKKREYIKAVNLIRKRNSAFRHMRPGLYAPLRNCVYAEQYRLCNCNQGA